MAMRKAEGAYLEDTEGNRYLDAVGGLWCTNIGMGRDEMADVIAAQVREMAYTNPFVNVTHGPVAQLASRLAELAPGDLNHSFFTTGGSTAIDSAFRLIQYYQACRGKKNKRHIISRHEAYHGSTYAAMSISGKRVDRVPEFDYITDIIHHIACPNYYRAPAELTEEQFMEQLVSELEDKILELGADNVAAFFAEPVLGSGGVIVPPKGYHQRTWEVCRRHDVLYVSDEVVTAFGRLGHWFASLDEFGIQPDIITTAKGITSAYMPLGAVLYSDAIHDVISERGHGRCFAHGFTYSGHPVSCAAALQNIHIIERESLLENARDVGGYFAEQLNTLRDLAIVGDVRGLGMMMCVELVANKNTRTLFPKDIDIGSMVSREAAVRGLLVRPIFNLNVMSPPLTITRQDVDFIVTTLRSSIQASIKELAKMMLARRIRQPASNLS